MKVYLPLMVQDPLIAKYPGVERVVEGMHLYLEDGSLISDGPSLPWLRILDRNIQTAEETPVAVRVIHVRRLFGNKLPLIQLQVSVSTYCYHPGSNGPGSEKPWIDSTFA